MTVTIMAFDRAPRVTRCAFDRKSVRRYDQDGRLHIAVSNMAKEAVDQYVGEEIPGCHELGLDPKKIYRLYRPAEELEKAVPSFNNLPILREHIPVSAEAPQQELVIGSTGTDAAFADGFIRNSAVIWVQDDIDDIESEEKREWSPGYYYTPDMTPGKFNGLQYDGVMRDIVGNHVALVDQGRQGRDVVVGDRQPETLKMAALKSRRALMLHGALAAVIGPMLAQDSKVNLTAALGKVSAKTRGKDADKIASAVVKATTPKLAQDEGLAVEDVVKIINAVDGVEGAPAEDEDDIPEPGPDADDGMVNDADNDVVAKIMSFLDGKLSEEDMAELGNLVGGGQAQDEDGDEQNGDGKDSPTAPKPPAMDRKTVGKVLAEIRAAERAVFPHIGEVSVAMDSPAAIYRLALENAGVDLAGVPTSAYKAMVAMLPAPGAKGETPVLALDRQNAGKSFAERFPQANTLIAS